MSGYFSIFDAKALAYLEPFYSANDATATRRFMQNINNRGSQFDLWTEDYSLFHLGQWDELQGKHVDNNAPRHICNGVTLKLTEPTDIKDMDNEV